MSPPPSAAVAAPLSLEEFFGGVRAGRLVVLRCTTCGELAVPPKSFCPGCEGTGWEQAPLGGEGQVASFTVIRVPPNRLAPEAPYVIAVVRMAEGVSLLGRLEGVPLDLLRVGMPVRLAPPTGGHVAPPVITFAPHS